MSRPVEGSPDCDEDLRVETYRLGAVLGLLAGAPLMAYGVWWTFHNAALTMPEGLGPFIAVLAGLNDLLLIPLGFAVAWLVARVVPSRVRPPVLGALFASAAVGLYAVPIVTRYGTRATNPTIVGRPGWPGLLIALGIIWLIAGALVMRRARGSAVRR